MKKTVTQLCIVSAVTMLISSQVLSQTPGSLDTSFDTDGKVAIPIPGTQSAKGTATLIQPDGKIIVVGQSIDNVPNAADGDYVVIRFLPNGAPDNTFGTGGYVITELNAVSGAASVAIEPITGKIVIAGFAEVTNSNVTSNQISIFRYNSDGTPDTGFGYNGSIVEAVGISSTAHSIIVQSNGKILVGGYSNAGFVALRYFNDGTSDFTFNGNGVGVIPFTSTQFHFSSCMMLQPDGKVVLGGSVRNSNKRDLVLGRLNADGTVDTGFGTNGVFQTISTATSEEMYAIGRQSDGKIVVAGVRGDNISAPQNILIARYNENGGLDASFGTSGIVIDGFTANDLSSVKALVLQPDGKIIVGGKSYTGSPSAPTNVDFALARFSTTGTVDASFGNNGKVITAVDANGELDAIYAMALQSDGKLVVAGESFTKIAVARYGAVTSTAGLDEVSNTINAVTVFPNPATDQFTISYNLAQESEVAVHMCDVSGRYIATLTIPSSETAGEHAQVIQLPAVLESGCYYVVLTVGNHQKTQRIVVSR